MPIYVYECSACGKTIEVEQRITEDPLKDCECGGKGTLKRVIQPIAVMFKGAGFHINDYAPKSDAPKEGADKPKEEAKPAASETKADPSPGTVSSPAPEPSKPAEKKTEA